LKPPKTIVNDLLQSGNNLKPPKQFFRGSTAQGNRLAHAGGTARPVLGEPLGPANMKAFLIRESKNPFRQAWLGKKLLTSTRLSKALIFVRNAIIFQREAFFPNQACLKGFLLSLIRNAFVLAGPSGSPTSAGRFPQRGPAGSPGP